MRRFFRIEHNGGPRYVIEEQGAWRLLDGDIFARYTAGEAIASTGHKLLAPVLPSKIVCVGLNYKDHAAEQNKPLPPEPLIFIKPSTSVIGPDQAIVLPEEIGRVDHEAECGVVIGKRATRVSQSEAMDYVLGIICVNDVTARELQNKGASYTRAKGFDTFAPIGPCIAQGLDYNSAGGLTVEGWVNGERRQASSTKELIFPIPMLIAYISANMTLLPGDIISTGTPAGIGPLHAGDTVTIKVEGAGELTNSVR
ncbi:MAG: fumarylacetoacetate hydrolase family protein [Acidobacteriota bacterium]|nr:fumarylacetoacetate hydrolase family protein [Acidobacteriota bacterium]MDQ3417755.1 fumarylacetoacetate hydrolase family protein [Acidobacteriota bacterium]